MKNRFLFVVRPKFTPATVLAVIALVLAMSGGAYAAKKYLITSTKQISPSVLKSLKGLPGPAGPPGPVGSSAPGTAGAVGPVGPQGSPGVDGKEGVQGKEGVPGKTGKEGKPGSPWTVGGTLPVDATETGLWTVPSTATFGQFIPLASFPIALSASLLNSFECGAAGKPSCSVHYINASGMEEPEPGVTRAKPSECPGTVTEPQAVSGNFCVYVGELNGVSSATLGIGDPFSHEAGAVSRFGAELQVLITVEEPSGVGTWAVTG